MTEDIKSRTKNPTPSNKSANCETVCLNENLSCDYAELTVSSSAHIIFPKNLPIKITIAGVRTIIHVGEFAIIPPNCIFAINSSPERYCIDFDFDMVINNPDFTVLLPIITNPCVYHPISAEQGLNTGYTTWYFHAQVQTADANTGKNAESLANGTSRHIHENLISPVSIIKEIVSMLSSDKFHFTASYCLAKILEIYSLLGEEIIYSGFNGRHESAAAHSIADNLSASVQYILSNYNTELNLEDAANVAGYSRAHYSKLFKEFYGLSFYDYLLNVRVRSAALLLANTEMQIAEVGAASGFSSSSTLNRVFKQETGFSPRDYRKSFPKTYLTTSPGDSTTPTAPAVRSSSAVPKP